MTDVTVVGDLLKFGDRRVDLPGPLEVLREDGDLVVAVARETTEQEQRNVLAFDREGGQRWRVDRPPHEMPGDDRRSPWYLNGWFADGELWTRNANGRLYRIDRADGTVERAVPYTELPLPDGETASLPFPVDRFVRVDGLTVGLLDWTREAGSPEEDPGPRNVVAVAADGTERWRVEGVAVQDRSVELWSEDDSPAKLAQSNRYDDLWYEDGELVAEHRYGLAGTVDPATGAVTLRGVAEVDDRIVFGEHDVVELPDPVWSLGEVGQRVVALTAAHREAAVWRTRNVVAFDRTGQRLWRIDAPAEDDPVPFETIWPVSGRLLARSHEGRIHEVDTASGGIVGTYDPDEFPFEDRVRSFPYPVRSVAARNGVVVLCLDAYGEGAYVEEPIASDRCVLAFDEDGDELWQVEAIGNEDVFTDVGRDGDQLTAHSFDGRNMHVDWETGEWRLRTRRLW